MSEFINIVDPRILAVPLKECGEPLVDIKQEKRLVYGPPPDTPETTPHYTLMRERVYALILKAQALLPKGYSFRLYEGYRCLTVQQFLFDEMSEKVKHDAPHLTGDELFYETTRLVSPVKNLDGSDNIPAHNTGGAIDIEILDDKGDLLDMGMAAKDWVEVDADLCMTHCDTLSTKQQNNRKLLFDVMTHVGFVNYPSEWWHFSYGDKYWAYHHQTTAFYNCFKQ